jgi:colicin import membrane protein
LSDAVVLTSENAQDFYAKKLGLVTEPAPDKPAPDAANAADGGESGSVESSEAAHGEEPGAKEAAQQQAESDPEKKQKLNLRFSELSKQRDEAKALAEKNAADLKAERDARELAEKRARDLEAKLNPPAQAEQDELGPEPKPEQFKDAFEYAKALAEWSTDKALHDRDAKEAEARAQEAQQKAIEAFRERQAAFKATAEDYEAVIAASPVAVSNELRDAILDSEVGPQILYHFAQNPADAQRINALKAGAALRELGKLEAKLASAKAPEPKGDEARKPAAAATEISRAPAPISPIRGSGSAVAGASVDGDGVFHGTYAEWKAQRKAGKIK